MTYLFYATKIDLEFLVFFCCFNFIFSFFFLKMDPVVKAKRKTMKEQAKDHFITIFGDKLQLVPSHADRWSKEICRINRRINNRIDRRINRQIREDKISFRSSMKILLLGPESARAEVFHHIYLGFGLSYTDSERRETKVFTLRRTISAMKTLLEHLECLSIENEQKPDASPLQLDDEEIDVLRAIERLWNDPLFQERLNKSTECQSLLKEVI